MTNYEQVIEEISRTRDVFDKLNDFFCKADQNIANDPDDPREGIGRFPGFDRLMFLIPCVISRLEEDVSKSKGGEGHADYSHDYLLSFRFKFPLKSESRSK